MYDFDTPVSRWSTNSYKWNIKEGELPMWVADMDFKTSPAIISAIEKRVENGIYGYNTIPDEWSRAYVNWWDRRHHFKMEKDWLIFCTGVVPAISSCVRKLTDTAENVLILTPVYNIFFNCIYNNGRNILESRLRYENERYDIDWKDFEEKLSNPQTSLLIFCNPHNPVGKIWDKETLARIGELCKTYHVTVISDEIHCDLTVPGCEYVPFASASEICSDISVTCIAPTKCFNIAGLQTAAVSVPNPLLRHKVWRALNTDEVAEPNTFAVQAAVAAFEEGEPWLDELNAYTAANRSYVEGFVRDEIPELSVVSGSATYLLWIDVSRITEDSKAFSKFLREKTGLFVSEGKEYGGDGKKFIRLNVACPRCYVEDAVKRLKGGVALYLHSK